MSDFLTAKQVIDLLKIDRTTLYRMLREERIKGVKIGSHWRFAKEEVDVIIGRARPSEIKKSQPLKEILPLHCIEPIQEVFADIAQVASLTTDPDGIPLTKTSNSCNFCNLIQSSEKGKEGCFKSWQNLKLKNDGNPKFNKCHAGLNYSGSVIKLGEREIAKLVAGQFFTKRPIESQLKNRVKKLAKEYNLPEDELFKSAKEIPVLDKRTGSLIGKWIIKVSKSFERMGLERKELINRLKNIAEISGF